MGVSEGESGEFGWPETVQVVRQGEISILIIHPYACTYTHGTGLQNGNPMEVLPYMYSIKYSASTHRYKREVSYSC